MTVTMGPGDRDASTAAPTRQLAADTLTIIALRATAVGLNLAVSVALARTAGAYAYGLYVFALSTAVVLAIPNTAALATLLLREVASAAAQARWDVLRGVERWATRRALVTSVTTAGLALCAVLTFGGGMATEWRLTVAIGLALVPILSLNALRAALLRGLHHVVLGQFPDQIAVPVVILLLLGGGVIFGRPAVDSVTAITWHVTAAVAALTVGIVLVRRRRPVVIRTTRATSTTRTWRASLMTFLVLSGLGLVNQELHVILLGALIGPTEAGIFRVTMRGAELVAFALTGINVAIGPTIARLHTLGERGRVRRLVVLSALVSSLWGVPVAIVMIAFGPVILGTIFGRDFVAGATSLSILSIGQLVNAMTGSVGLLLNMTGRERVAARGQGIATVVNLGVGLVLIPRWGIDGAAVATAASLATWNAIFALEARRL